MSKEKIEAEMSREKVEAENVRIEEGEGEVSVKELMERVMYLEEKNDRLMADGKIDGEF